jgi:hypothetical protein
MGSEPGFIRASFRKRVKKTAMKPCGFREGRRGVTRADVAVVALVVCLAIGMLLVVAAQQRESSRRLQCERNFAQTSESIIRYDELRGQLPGWRVEIDGQARSWGVAVLPYLGIPLSKEELESGERTERPGPWKELSSRVAKSADEPGKPIPTVNPFVCPTVPLEKRPVAPLSIGVNGGMPDVAPKPGFPPDWPQNGVFQDGTFAKPPWTMLLIAHLDGTQTTVMLAENADAGPWTSTEESRLAVLWFPESLPETPSPLLPLNQDAGAGDGSLRFARPASLHKGGWVTAYCDGSVKWTHGQIDPVAWSQLMSVDGTNARLPGHEEYLPSQYRREPMESAPEESVAPESDEPNPPKSP